MVNMIQLMTVFISSVLVTGTNIMLGRPSVQSSDYYNNNMYHFSSYANDGNTNTQGITNSQQNPYWEGDLQGYYHVTSVTVTSMNHAWAQFLQNAYIGISVHDVNCPDMEVTKCGQWPGQTLPGHTITFNCSHPSPVRFVRVWREVNSYLNVAEVEVEGEPTYLPDAQYDKYTSKKVTSSTASLTVDCVTDCATRCHRYQPCLAFSYSPSQQPNCLLATDATMATDTEWRSYSANTCFKAPNC